MPLGLYEQESFFARAHLPPATVATLATPAQLFLKNNGLLVCCAQNVVATVTRQLRQVGFTLVLVGVVLLTKSFEGRAKMAGSHHRDVGLFCGVVWAVRRQGRMKNQASRQPSLRRLISERFATLSCRADALGWGSIGPG